jgi:hypothetical protein
MSKASTGAPDTLEASERKARAAAKVLVIVDRKRGRKSPKWMIDFAEGKKIAK